MFRFSGSLLRYPARAAFAWYAGLISLGAVLLRLPFAVVAGARPLTAVDALFTSASAVCVTGLTVRSTGNELSAFGQAVVLALIQIGGVGIMTVTTFVVLRLGGRESLRRKEIVRHTLGGAGHDLRRTLWRIMRLVLACEAAGCVLLVAAGWRGGLSARSVWEACFHAISAFCNAGFSLRDASLAADRASAPVNLTIMALIVLGGLGFPVIHELAEALREACRGRRTRLSAHCKLMLAGTAALLAGGMLAVLVLEWSNALRGMPPMEKLLVAAFQSTTTRTAGFETVPMAGLTNATLFVFMVLMVVGGGPCSTAGGFKVTTLCVLGCHAWSKFRGRRRPTVFRRAIADTTVDGATATLLLFALVAAVGLTGLLFVEQADAPHLAPENVFLDAAFEVCSALGTVGLSTGITPGLAPAAKLIVVGLMFLGRLGPLSVFAAVARVEAGDLLDYPKAEILVG